jgi:disulfide bond formation protein DsbB
MFQRVCIVVLGIVFLIAALHPARRTGAIVYGVLIMLAAGAATWVAGRHVWIQHQPAGTVPSCGAPLDNLLQMFPLLEVVRRVMTGGGECAKIDWTFLMAVTLGLVGIVNNIVSPVRKA